MLIPYGDRLIVEAEDSRPSSFEVNGISFEVANDPNSLENRPTKARVLAIGDVTGIEPGDTVHFDRYSGRELELEGTTYLILLANEVLAYEKG